MHQNGNWMDENIGLAYQEFDLSEASPWHVHAVLFHACARDFLRPALLAGTKKKS